MNSRKHIRTRFALGILLGAILLICAKILFDYPMGRTKVESLFPDHEQRESSHAIRRAISVDEYTWKRAETLTNQSLILGLLGAVASLVALHYARQLAKDNQTIAKGGNLISCTRPTNDQKPNKTVEATAISPAVESESTPPPPHL